MEKRLSNFLLWQCAYAELFFVDKMWPEFEKEDFVKILKEFNQRERRFGMTSEQLTSLVAFTAFIGDCLMVFE